MNLNLYDIKYGNIIFKNNISLLNVKELNISNCEITNIENLTECININKLNLSFNHLRSIADIASCSNLINLNVSHNKLKSFEIFGNFEIIKSDLQVFNLSYNSITSISTLNPLTFPNLSEVWLCHNEISNLNGLVDSLSQFTKLKSVFIKPGNMCCSTEPVELYRYLLISRIPTLTMLDATPVLESERIKATEFMKSFNSKGVIALNTDISSLKLRNNSIRASSANQMTSILVKENTNTNESDKTDPDTSVKRNSISISKTLSRNNSFISIKPSNIRQDIEVQNSMMLSSPSLPSLSSYKETTLPIIRDNTSQMSSLMAAVSSLPTFSKSVRNPSSLTHLKKKLDKFEIIDHKEVELLAKYSHLCLSNALRLKYINSLFGLSIGNNGTGSVQWPNGNVAVSVEKIGTDYTLYTSYKKQSGLLAIHWSPKSGLVNYLNGQTFLVSNTNHLNGMIYSTAGKLLITWENGNVSLKVNKKDVTCYYEESSCNLIELKLDNTLGVRYNITKSLLEVFFSCKNIRYRFINGFNEPIQPDDNLLSDRLFEMTEEIFEKKTRANTISTSQLIDQIRQSSSILDKMKLPYSSNLNNTYSSNT